MTEFEVVWSGAHKDTYLCVTEPRIGDMSHLAPMVIPDEVPKKHLRPHQSRVEMHQQILAVLAGRGPMTVRDLRTALGTNDAQFYNLVSRMTRHGVILRPERGFVQAVR